MKRILITGKNSYIGTSFKQWLSNYPDKYEVDSISVRDDSWKERDFSRYDVVYHVAALVHKKEKPEMKDLYFRVNRDLAYEVANKAKHDGVKQFIFLSTMSVYGEEGNLDEKVVITPNTPVSPKTFYGKSKLEAEIELNKLNDNIFKVVLLRPPMVYGPNCPGNYARLERLAVKLPMFPMIENERSMIHIDTLCQHVKEYIDNEDKGTFFPQDDEYVNTSIMVKDIAHKNGKSIYLSKSAGWVIKMFFKRLNLVKKAFGNLVYEK